MFSLYLPTLCRAGKYPGRAIDFNTFEAKRRKFQDSPASDGMDNAAADNYLSEYVMEVRGVIDRVSAHLSLL